MNEAVQTPNRREPRFFKWISALEITIGSLALATIFVMVLIQALQRYLPVSGWPWTGELARYSLAWLTFILVGYLTGQGRQITLQMIDTLKSKRVVHAVKVFANLATAAIALGFAAACFDLVSNDTGQVSPALGMPMIWLYVIPLAGFAFTALRAVAAVFLPDLDINPAEDRDNPSDPADPQDPPAKAGNPNTEVTP